MRKVVSILIVSMILIIPGCSYDSSKKDEMTASETIDLLEMQIEELETDIEFLTEENISLESQVEESERRIEILEEYVNELESLLEEDGVEGFTDSHGEAYIKKDK